MCTDLIRDDESKTDEKPPEANLHPIGTGSCVGDSQTVGRIVCRDTPHMMGLGRESLHP